MPGSFRVRPEERAGFFALGPAACLAPEREIGPCAGDDPDWSRAGRPGAPTTASSSAPQEPRVGLVEAAPEIRLRPFLRPASSNPRQVEQDRPLEQVARVATRRCRDQDRPAGGQVDLVLVAVELPGREDPSAWRSCTVHPDRLMAAASLGTALALVFLRLGAGARPGAGGELHGRSLMDRGPLDPECFGAGPPCRIGCADAGLPCSSRCSSGP